MKEIIKPLMANVSVNEIAEKLQADTWEMEDLRRVAMQFYPTLE